MRTWQSSAEKLQLLRLLTAAGSWILPLTSPLRLSHSFVFQHGTVEWQLVLEKVVSGFVLTRAVRWIGSIAFPCSRETICRQLFLYNMHEWEAFYSNVWAVNWNSNLDCGSRGLKLEASLIFQKGASLRKASSALLWGKRLTFFTCGTALFPLSDLLETIRVRFVLLRLLIRRDIIARGEVGIDLGQKYFLSDSFKSRQKRENVPEVYFMINNIIFSSTLQQNIKLKVLAKGICIRPFGRQVCLCRWPHQLHLVSHFMSQNKALQINLQTHWSEPRHHSETCM